MSQQRKDLRMTDWIATIILIFPYFQVREKVTLTRFWLPCSLALPKRLPPSLHDTMRAWSASFASTALCARCRPSPSMPP